MKLSLKANISKSFSRIIFATAASLGLISISLPTATAASSLACTNPSHKPSSLGTLTLASLPSNISAAQWGIEQGCFSKYGIDIKTVIVGTSPLGMAGLVSGSFDLFMNTPSNLLMTMANSDFKGKIVAPRHSYSADDLARAKQEPLYSGQLLLQSVMLVRKNSPIASWKDLENRKIGVKSFNGADQAGVVLAMRASGANTSRTQFLTLTDSQMGPALDRGDIDAIVPSDPVATQLITGGDRVIGYPTAYFFEPGVAVAYVSSAEIVSRKTAAMRAFQRAVLEINRLLNLPQNDASYRKVIVETTGVSEATAAALKLPTMTEKNVSFADIAYLPNKLLSLRFTRNRVNLAPILFH